ncbi:MAG: hypothetical protein ACLFVJ_07310 [Persicimonas sp.]
MTDDLHRIADALRDYAEGDTTITISVDDGEIRTSEARIVSLLRAQLTETVDLDGLDEQQARTRLRAVEALCADILEGEHHGAAQALAVRVLGVMRGGE